MSFTTLVPTVFYTDVAVGIDLFVDGLGLEVVHRDDDLVVVLREWQRPPRGGSSTV